MVRGPEGGQDCSAETQHSESTWHVLKQSEGQGWRLSGWASLAAFHCNRGKVGTRSYSEVFCGGTGKAAKWAKDGGKLKVVVYGEGAVADSGNGLKWGKGSIQGPAFLPMQHISSARILLMEPLAVPLLNKLHWFLDYFCSLSPHVGAQGQSGMIRSLLARRLAYYNLMTGAQHTEQKRDGNIRGDNYYCRPSTLISNFHLCSSCTGCGSLLWYLSIVIILLFFSFFLHSVDTLINHKDLPFRFCAGLRMNPIGPLTLPSTVPPRGWCSICVSCSKWKDLWVQIQISTMNATLSLLFVCPLWRQWDESALYVEEVQQPHNIGKRQTHAALATEWKEHTLIWISFELTDSNRSDSLSTDAACWPVPLVSSTTVC